jgi:hypothetical protein
LPLAVAPIAGTAAGFFMRHRYSPIMLRLQ